MKNEPSNMRFACSCGNHWLSEEYDANDKSTSDYEQGFNCPKCGSEDISGEDIK